MESTGGNTGNVAFVFGAKQILANSTTRITWGMSPQEVKSKVDHLVVTCANQLGPHFNLGRWADALERFELPVTLIGLGAQSDNYDSFPEIPEESARFLSVCTELRPNKGEANIGVRGSFTQRFLNTLNVTSTVTGCPSLFINADKQLGSTIRAFQNKTSLERIAIAAGNPWHRTSSFLEKSMMEIVDSFKGSYVVQHPDGQIRLACGELEGTDGLVDRYLAVCGDRFTSESLREWFRRFSYYFTDAATWIDFLRRFDLVIGARYHGVALGLQAGRPGCVFTIDSRTRELCETTSVKWFDVQALKNLSTGDLLTLARWNESDTLLFDANRVDRAQTVRAFLESNDLIPSDHLKLLAE